MKFTKLWIGLIVVLLVGNAVSLSYIVAKQRGQFKPYTLTRLDYLQLKMDDHKIGFVSQFNLALRGLHLYPVNNDTDIEMVLTWDESIRIGAVQDSIRDAFVTLMKTYLKGMYELGDWEANPTIVAIQKIGDDEVTRTVTEVDTSKISPIEPSSPRAFKPTLTGVGEKVYTCSEILSKWDKLSMSEITVLVPKTSFVTGASILATVAGRANIYFNLPTSYLSELQKISSNGFTTQDVLVKGTVAYYSLGGHVRHLNNCKLILK